MTLLQSVINIFSSVLVVVFIDVNWLILTLVLEDILNKSVKLVTFWMCMLFIFITVLLIFIRLDCESVNIKSSTDRILSKVIDIKSRLFGLVTLDIVTLRAFKVEEVTLIAISIVSISDIVESVKLVVDKNEFNSEFCCVMLDEFWIFKDAEIRVKRT